MCTPTSQFMHHSKEMSLVAAAGTGDPLEVLTLLEEGIGINDRGIAGCTALMMAAEYDYTDIGVLLLEWNADVNAENDSGDTAIIIACRYGGYEMVKLLLDHGANPNMDSQIIDRPEVWSPLAIAAFWNHDDVVSLLLDRGARINAINCGETALMVAADSNNIDCVRVLLDYGADISVMKVKDGKTAYDMTDKQEIRDMINEYVSRPRSMYTNGDKSRSYMSSYHDIDILVY